MENIKKLLEQDFEYRNELLTKYSDILLRSEARVDNVNHMIHDLISNNASCSQRLEQVNQSLQKEQEINLELVHILKEKDARIEHLENLLERMFSLQSGINTNNFNLKN